jgi:hypothetical protein
LNGITTARVMSRVMREMGLKTARRGFMAAPGDKVAER